jgi:signal transduction histidine kinase
MIVSVMSTRFFSFLRRWTAPAILVGLAGLLTVPWSVWVILAAYERDVNERAAMLAHRVKIQLAMAWYAWPNQWTAAWTTPQQVLEPLKAELLGDSTVQAVCFLDFYKRTGGFVRRSDSIPIPHSMEEASGMLNADPTSYRQIFTWDHKNGQRGLIYIDLSRAQLRTHFREAYWHLLRNVAALTAAGFIVISSVCIFAYRLWNRATRQRRRAQLEQQGLLAERVLTAAVLAHEIRNPLGALRFQLASLRHNAADPARVGQTADTIDTELLRVKKLVEDYLAHEEAQAMPVAPVDLAESVRNLHTLMGELLRETGTRFIVINAPRKVVVAADPHALRQVLMNLVLNAQQAMGRGGAITISISQDDKFGAVAVSDTGPGIPPEMRDRLFKPFATSRKGGSGIGLALVERFVKNFNGSVSVDSPPGKGATFRLRLPLFAPTHTQSQEADGHVVRGLIT